MATLDTIMQMQQSGMSEAEITNTLQTQGVPPKEINDALNQAQVKSAVTQSESNQKPMAQVPSPYGEQQQMPTGQPQQQMPTGQPQQQTTAGQPQDQMQPAANDPYQNYYQDTPQAYTGDEYYQQPTYDTETITEIAEQVISEKFKEFNNKTGDIATFRSVTQDKIDDMNTRLKRIETTIDKLQQAIIQKIGEFGDNTASIKKDLSGLHDTTSKLMNPLIDNYRELQKITKKNKK